VENIVSWGKKRKNSELKTSFHLQKTRYIQLENDAEVHINLSKLEFTVKKRHALNSVFTFNTVNSEHKGLVEATRKFINRYYNSLKC